MKNRTKILLWFTNVINTTFQYLSVFIFRRIFGSTYTTSTALFCSSVGLWSWLEFDVGYAYSVYFLLWNHLPKFTIYYTRTFVLFVDTTYFPSQDLIENSSVDFLNELSSINLLILHHLLYLVM